MEPSLVRVIAEFDLPGTLLSADPFGSGLINDTYLCLFSTGNAVRKYLLQRINRSVFRRPEQVMENVELVTRHIRERLRREGVAEPETVAPALVHVRGGRSFLTDAQGESWRMFHFIESGAVFDTVQGPEHAREIGRALGRFQALVADIPASRLHDTLPGFHHTPGCLAGLDEAVRQDPQGRASGARGDLAFVSSRRPLAALLMDRIGDGTIPVRVVHNDPKVNNVLVEAATGKALCMVDLDTVKPGVVHFDFGDAVRSATNPAGEDVPDLGSVRFDRERYEALAGGYLDEARSFLTDREIALLPASARVITYELGIRFLADHLRGDVYFKISRPGQNLHRARVQFRLLQSMEQAGL